MVATWEKSSANSKAASIRLILSTDTVLDILVGPLEHLGEDVQDRLSASVAVRLVRQQNQPCRAAASLDRLEEPIGLNREGSRIVVGLTMDQQQGGFDLVGIRERRHFHVKLGRLPERPPFGLESEGRQSPVAGAGAGDAGGEEVGVGEWHCARSNCRAASCTQPAIG